MLRLPQKTSISLLGVLGLYSLTSINMHVLLENLLHIAIACMIAMFLYNLLLLAKTYLLGNMWADMEAEDRIGYTYPVKQLQVLYGENQMAIKVAGVSSEVDTSDTPFDFGLPAHINYVVHIEDLANYSDDDLVELINNTYLCQYQVNEK